MLMVLFFVLVEFENLESACPEKRKGRLNHLTVTDRDGIKLTVNSHF